MSRLDKFKTFSGEYKLIWLCVALAIIGLAVDVNFFSFFNINSLFYQVAILGLLAIGQSIVILIGGIDLSVGNVASMTTVFLSWAMIQLSGVMSGDVGITILSLLIAVGFAMLLGLISGLSVAYLKVPPIISTLGTMWIAKALAFYMFGGQAQPFEVPGFQIIGSINIGSVPLVFFIVLGILALVYIILTQTKIGRSLYAIGGNEFAAYISGIKINRYKIGAFLTAALCSGVAGIFIAAYTRTGYARAGDGYELVAIAGVIIGGFSMAGGKGNVINSMLGILLLRLLSKLLIFAGLSGYLENLWVGLILIGALILNDVKIERKTDSKAVSEKTQKLKRSD